MQDAANRLIGEHDFASFAGAGWGVPSEEGDAPGTVRRLTTANWFLQDLPGEPQLLVLELAANAFLPHMVRNIVGTLLQVGKGERTPAEFEAILAAKDRRLAGPTAPASGLALVNVTYEESKDRIERTQSPVG
jgi:tRNA pseudouridine38-40 synthase